MAKRKNWFDFVKEIFTSDAKAKQEKKEKRKRWLFGKLKGKRSPSLPPPSLPKSKALKEAEEEQSKHALAVAVATAAAAEAAVAAAQAAAEVVRLTGTPLAYQQSRELAAIKIQTAFRGYLARRALRALKALVKLQALVRGRAVRRQTTLTLISLQSLIKIQAEARANRIRMSSQACEANDHLQRNAKEFGETNAKDTGKRWDGSPLSKEELNAILLNRQEASLKRERAMEYASSHQGKRNYRRHSLLAGKELEPVNLNHRWSWLESWVDTQPWDRNIPDVVPAPSPDRSIHDRQQHIVDRAANLDSVHRSDGWELRPMMRRSFNWSRRSYIRDDESLTSSPAFPGYMAFTESAKARSRSVSTPKQRPGTTGLLADNCSLHTSRLLSPFPSVCSDAGFAKLSKLPTLHHQRSPRLKAQSGPVKSPGKGSQL